MVCDSSALNVTDASHDDMTLVHRCKSGDVGAFEELVRRYDRKVFRIAQHVTRNREDAQDVVQEAFLKAFRKLQEFRENSQFATWLVRITINQSLTKLRQPHKRREVVLDQDPQEETGAFLPYEVADWAPNPEERYRSSELKEILTHALQALRPALSLVFVLRDIEGLSTEQTSEALDLSESAVKSRLMRARLQLREQLSKFFRTNGKDELIRKHAGGVPHVP
jgi:RNA polymerase sigma-70 factor (ECF subfamily)